MTTPVLDNHCHIDPRNGDGIDAVRRFARAGGTHICIVNKPSWSLGVEASESDDFRDVFDETLRTVEEASEVLEGRAFGVLGVHPGLVSKLLGRWGGPQNEEAVERAERVMKEGLEVAAEYVGEGSAIALKSGRPHYDVQEPTWETSNNVMQHAFELGAEVDCAVQLHTESADDFTDIRGMAEGVGMPPDRVVKHFSSPSVSAVQRSVIAYEENVFEAVEDGRDFLLETDYIDDPERPGAVLGTRTVPRRVDALLDEGYDDAVERACVTLPEEIYGVEISV
ncbi:TatD family hydrolase [Haladaptatus sp. F3-133]|uniref:TatD family hydrolase n=1 Tax=Halorutilus salinus TaxID=2487751 RepID=A0A9Q4C1J2_9EURY|nr:TatD family hydrolase [Halorutilus salinus]